MTPATRYRAYSDYLTQRYGGRTYRVSVDAGFTCPVRDRGKPCAYCDEAGSRAAYLTRQNSGSLDSIPDQVRRGIDFLQSRYQPEHLLLYYQAFSNTYGDVDHLRRVYDAGLRCASFRGLIIGTRPDCIDEQRARLLQEYRNRGLDVWVELGLQSASDQTLREIDRGHTVGQFDQAVGILKGHDINIAAHLILGLPGEGVDEVIRSARHISRLQVDGVKLHNLVVLEGTPLYDRCMAGGFQPPSPEHYLKLLTAAVEHLDPAVVIMRLTCDPPRGVVHLPEVLPDKGQVHQQLESELGRRNSRQGIYWSGHADQ